MIEYTDRARRQIEKLREYYVDKERVEALLNLDAALEEAEAKINADPRCGAPAPRPYPHLRKAGILWVKGGPYWVAYVAGPPVTVAGVFYDRADIPRRV